MMTEDTERLCGPRHGRTKARAGHRWGRTKGKLAFHGGTVAIERPRVRSLAGGEVRDGQLRLDSFPLSISGRSAGCRRGVPFSGWHAGRA
jgi:hypothetical protein